MTRADLIKEAIVYGLCDLGRNEAAQVIENATFIPSERKIIVVAPRSRLDPHRKAPETTIAFLREAIDDGLRVNGFHDIVSIEP